MATITAKGILQGREIGLVCIQQGKGYEIKLSNADEVHRAMVLERLKEDHAVGGTYWPEKDSMLHVYNVCRYYLFDKLIEIELDGELEPIPYQEGVIY